MSKYDCSKTLDYAHERNRMCDTNKNKGCNNCTLYGGGGESCYGIRYITQEHINIVQKWSDEHPEKTRKDVFFEMFPQAMRTSKELHESVPFSHKKGFEEGYTKGYIKGKKDADPKWIPVSEGLPKENENVIVTAVFSDGKDVGMLKFIEGKWTNDFFNYDVVAWMPLPEPYVEEKG